MLSMSSVTLDQSLDLVESIPQSGLVIVGIKMTGRGGILCQ